MTKKEEAKIVSEYGLDSENLYYVMRFQHCIRKIDKEIFSKHSYEEVRRILKREINMGVAVDMTLEDNPNAYRKKKNDYDQGFIDGYNYGKGDKK